MLIQAQTLDERIEHVYQIADAIEMPTGEEEYIFPKYKNGKEIKDFLDHKKEGLFQG